MPGYGDRIYKKRRSGNLWPLIIIVLILGGGTLFFMSLREPDPFLEDSTAINEDAVESHVSVPEKDEESSLSSTPINEVSEEGTVQDHSIPTPFGNVPGGESLDSIGSKKKGSAFQKDIKEARSFYENGQYKEALDILSKHSHSNTEAMVYCGICYYLLEDYQNARPLLERALEKNSKHFLALKYMAFVYYKSDNLSLSLELAERALEKYPDNELSALRRKVIREKNVMKGYGNTKKVHFKIQFSKFEHEAVKETVVDILNDAYRTVGNEMNYYPENPVTVILYNEKGFFDVTRAPGWAGGLYDGKIRIPVKGVEGKEELLKRILVHEYIHALVHSITPKCPLWLNEGLAEYFSRGSNQRTIGQVIPLKYLEYRFPSRDRRLVAAAYIESYSVVCHLIDKHGLFRVKELLEAYSTGLNNDDAFNKVFYISYKRFMDTWGKE